MMVKSPARPGGRTEAAKQAMGGAVERAAVHLPARPADQLRRAGEHLLGGAAREGEEEDPLGGDARFDEMGDAIDERPGLSGAGAGDDEERTVSKSGGGGLLGVQLLGEVP